MNEFLNLLKPALWWLSVIGTVVCWNKSDQTRDAEKRRLLAITGWTLFVGTCAALFYYGRKHTFHLDNLTYVEAAGEAARMADEKGWLMYFFTYKQIP